MELIRSYSGPRKMEDLLDNSVLRCARISPTPPTAEDEIRAHNLMFGESLGLQEAAATIPDEDSRPAKRGRQEHTPQGVQTAPNVASGVVAGFWRTRQKKTSHGPRGARRLGESVATPTVGERRGSGEHHASPPARQAPGAEVGGSSRGTGIGTEGGSTSRPSGDTSGARGKGSAPVDWPSRYFTAESKEGFWDKASDLLIGKLPSSGGYDDEPDARHRFDPRNHLDSRASVFKSRYVQGKAVEQFSLPRDGDLLKEVPDVGLHAILRSYLTRGCLVERELYQRLSRGHQAFEKLREAYEAKGTDGGGELDQVVKDLSSKHAELDDWRREMEVKEQLIAELRASGQRKSAEIGELREQLHAGREDSGSLTEVLRERDVAVAQVALEKQVAQHAQSQLAVESATKERLEMECARLGESLQVARNRVKYLESDEYGSRVVAEKQPAVIAEYRRSAMAKFEVALACKAGCDYTTSQLPAEYREAPRRPPYPPVIADFVDTLSKLEEAGVGYDVMAGDAEEGEETSDSSASGSSEGGDKDAGKVPP